MTLAEAKEVTTATEFESWKEYFRRELNGFHRTDHYLARVCYQLYLIMHMLGGKPKLKEENFFIKFEAVGKDKDSEDKTREELDGVAQGMELKSTLMGILGIRPEPSDRGGAVGVGGETKPDHIVMAGERDPLPPVPEVVRKLRQKIILNRPPKPKPPIPPKSDLRPRKA